MAIASIGVGAVGTEEAILIGRRHSQSATDWKRTPSRAFQDLPRGFLRFPLALDTRTKSFLTLMFDSFFIYRMGHKKGQGLNLGVLRIWRGI